jgi:hypothetical protein
LDVDHVARTQIEAFVSHHAAGREQVPLALARENGRPAEIDARQ